MDIAIITHVQKAGFDLEINRESVISAKPKNFILKDTKSAKEPTYFILTEFDQKILRSVNNAVHFP